MMRRLYLQIYVTFLGILLLFGLLSAVLFVVLPHDHDPGLFDAMGRIAGRLLPAEEAGQAALEARLLELHSELGLDVTVYDAKRRLVATAGPTLEPPPAGSTRSGWVRRGQWMLALPNGRWLVARESERLGRHGLAWLGGLLLLGATIALGAYPVTRRITRRLERLRERVDALGAGDLTTRVDVEGSDEVAVLAQRFNRAADRIERLVGAQRRMLASASHELRTPLTRVRVAIELLGADGRPELVEQVSRDIAELDELIGELLAASRLEGQGGLAHTEDVDLLALVAEEASRSDVPVSGTAVRIAGDPRLLCRLVRNLLDNARRHGGDASIDVSVEPFGGGARLRVADRGPGVHPDERERIFEPFYRPAGIRETGEGVGLGLSLVRQIARSHGGDARCLAREGGGSLFEVDLLGATSC